jgi:Zn finger protein HypA/HybF involved in hydrogenase expression
MTESTKTTVETAATEEKPKAATKEKNDWRKRAEEAEAKLEALNQIQSPLSATVPEKVNEPKVPNPHSHHDNEPHYIGKWQQYCPTCGDKNPDFKDEVECRTCKTHLGAKDVAEKLVACPNCGGKHADVIKR